MPLRHLVISAWPGRLLQCRISGVRQWQSRPHLRAFYLPPTMGQQIKQLTPLPHPSPSVSFLIALSRYVLKGRADCWRRTVWALAVSPHTQTQTQTHTHTKTGTRTHTLRPSSAGTQVLTQQIRCIVALPSASRGQGVIGGGFSHHVEVRVLRARVHGVYRIWVKVTLVSLRQKSAALLLKKR